MLESYRQKIDKIDNEILSLLAKRFKISKEIGLYKQKNNIPFYQSERWTNLLQSRKEKGKEIGLSLVFIQNLRNIIHEESLNLQKKNG
ncbi:MAG: chorismate mutase [Candidatus Absconditabacteria bacterium]|nr:chorismate mutase [Candidatus Absconditabacteria bacterium]